MTSIRIWTRPILLMLLVLSLLLPDEIRRVKQSLFITALAGMVLWSLMGLTKEEVDDDA